MNEAAATLGPPERLHPVSLLASLAASARGMWGLFAAGGYFAIQGNWFLLVVTMAIYTVVSLSSAVLRWTKFSFSVGEREIRIDSGLLNRTHRSLPFDRIQDVTIEQNPLWRVLGMARVRFETGGSSGGGEDDGSLAAISLQRAAEIRDLVRASRGLAPAATSTAAPGRPDDERVFAMDLKRVMLAGVFNFSLAVVGGLIGLSQTMGDALGFDPFKRDFWEGMFAPGTPLGDYIQAHQSLTIAAGAVTLVLIGLATGMVRTILRDYGFRLDRSPTGIRRQRGLFTLTDVILPAKRTQAAIIGSGPLRAGFGWSELKLQSLAREEGGKGDHVVAPLASDTEIAQVLGAIGWQEPGGPQWRRVSGAYVGAFALALSPLLVLAGIQAALFASLPGFSDISLVSLALLACLLAMILFRALAWRRYAYVAEGERLLVRSGWWRRRIKILPIRNIQSADYHQTFIDRWFGIAGLQLGVAGGGMISHGIKALPFETARSLRDQLLSPFA